MEHVKKMIHYVQSVRIVFCIFRCLKVTKSGNTKLEHIEKEKLYNSYMYRFYSFLANIVEYDENKS